MARSVLTIITSIMLLASCNSSGVNRVVTVATVGGNPDGVTVTDSGNIYITDIGTGQVKHVSQDGSTEVVADLTAQADGITSVTDGTTEILYVADTGYGDVNGSITKIEIPSTGAPVVTTAFVDSTTLDNPTGIAADQNGNLYVADESAGIVYKIPVDETGPGTLVDLTSSTGATLDSPHGLTLVTNSDNSITLYTTDQGNGSNNVVKIDIPVSGSVTAVDLTPDNPGGTTTGTLNEARFDGPHGISTDRQGAIFVCDENNNRVQIITPAGNVVTFAGTGTSGDNDGDADAAMFNKPRGLATDAAGDLLVCDYGNGKVRKIVR